MRFIVCHFSPSPVNAAIRAIAALACLLLGSISPAHADGDDAPFTSLVALTSQRLALAEPVARWKWAHHEPITDEPREAALLASVKIKALDSGVDPAFAQRFFRDQIEASKDVQNALFANWRAARAPEGSPPDLATDTRPKLDRLTQSLIAALARVETDAPCRRLSAATRRQRRSLEAHDAL